MNKIFFRGFITVLPIALTIYIVYSAIIILENLLGSLLRQILPTYIPGLGFVLTLILIFTVGLLLNNFLTGRFMNELESRLVNIPFLKAIYSPLRDLMNLFQTRSANDTQSVVFVELGDSGAKAMGIVTRESFQDLPIHDVHDHIAVYFPLSYGLGGFTFLVPKSKVTKVDIPIEKAMSLAITGWVKVSKQEELK